MARTKQMVYSRGPMYVRRNYSGRIFVSEDTLVDLGVKAAVNTASVNRGRGMHEMKANTKHSMNTDEEVMEALARDGCFDSPCAGCERCDIQHPSVTDGSRCKTAQPPSGGRGEEQMPQRPGRKPKKGKIQKPKAPVTHWRPSNRCPSDPRGNPRRARCRSQRHR